MHWPNSHNGIKAQRQLARSHQRVAHMRQDFLHKTSTRLCRENQAIGIETLSIQGLMQNPRLARVTADQGFGQFFEMLKYKADRHGTRLVEAGRWFPSSKLCRPQAVGIFTKT
ncbi:MAG: transposase [Firmicutes bacterium]|nr:transposase [Bacillota bacterium]